VLKPAEMRKVNILVLGTGIGRITEELGRLGLLQLVDVKKQRAELGVREVDVSQLSEKWDRLERTATRLLDMLGVDRETEAGSGAELTPEKIEHGLETVEKQVKPVADRLAAIRREMEGLARVKKEVAAFRAIDTEIENLNEFSFLHFAVGSLSERGLRRFKATRSDKTAILIPVETEDGEEKVIAVTTKKGRWALESELEDVGFVKEDISDKYKGVPAKIYDEAEKRIEQLQRETLKLEAQRAALRERYGAFVLACRNRIGVELSVSRAQEQFGRTESTFLISGWVPAQSVPDLTEAMNRITAGRAVIEVRDPKSIKDVKEGKETVPVLLSNPSFLRPFEKLITTYGFPSYNEIEPTLFVAVSFLLMFGLMFGDLGQGCVIALLGLLLRKLLATREKAADMGAIMIYAGISAAIFGLLYGSVFGSEKILPPLWKNPMDDIMFFMALGVGFGVVMICLGIVLNVVNCLRRHDYLHGIFDKFGIVGGIFYAGCVGLAIKGMISGAETVTPGRVLLFVVLPLVIIFLREPIYNILTHKPGLVHGSVGTYIMESVIEIFEAVLSFLANTISFIRVSAFALSHVGLSIAIFEMADIIKKATGATSWSLLVIVLGNVLVIVLEGLIVAIQTVRLEYYEFFSKFFGGGGQEFKPFYISR